MGKKGERIKERNREEVTNPTALKVLKYYYITRKVLNVPTYKEKSK